jgi:hypothetical protein
MYKVLLRDYSESESGLSAGRAYLDGLADLSKSVAGPHYIYYIDLIGTVSGGSEIRSSDEHSLSMSKDDDHPICERRTSYRLSQGTSIRIFGVHFVVNSWTNG